MDGTDLFGSSCCPLSSDISVYSQASKRSRGDNYTSDLPGLSISHTSNLDIKPLFPTPPSTPPTAQPTWDDLPRNVAIAILSCGVLRLEDRLHLMLVSRKVCEMVHQAEATARRLRVCVTENEDDRVSSTFILRRIRRYSNLRVVTLLLSSSVHSNLCKTNQLLLTLAQNCPQLQELTLLLAQLRVKYLNDGLKLLGPRTNLTKLSLVNSAANDSTCSVIADVFPNLRSLGLLNCWQVSELGLMNVIDQCSQLTTLNVRHCKDISNHTIQYLITMACHRAKVEGDRCPRPVRVYAAHTAVKPDGLDTLAGDVIVLNKDPVKRGPKLLPIVSRKRKSGWGVSAPELDEQATRPDWEYDSDCDF